MTISIFAQPRFMPLPHAVEELMHEHRLTVNELVADASRGACRCPHLPALQQCLPCRARAYQADMATFLGGERSAVA